MSKFRVLLKHTWVWLRQDLHDFDLTREPESQRRIRQQMMRTIHSMQYDPHTQWRYHLRMTWFWVANIVPATALLYFVLFGPSGMGHIFLGVMLGLNTYYSLYANFAAEFGGLSSAWAALRGDQLSAGQKQLSEQIEDIEDDDDL